MNAAHDAEIRELRRRLEEADETLRAIRCGEVDALVVEGADGGKVYTLQGADHPYRVLIEGIRQGAVSLSAGGTVLYCNRCFAAMVKRPHEKVVGAAAADFLPPAQRPLFQAMLRQGRTRGVQRELRLEAGDGTALPVLVALAPLALADAAALCMVVTDLTEQKEHQDLQEVSRRKDEFLAMLAHELRNPLAPIRNAAALLHLSGRDGETLDYARDVIGRQVEHLSRLVEDLLDMSRINLGKVKLQKERVELGAVVARAVEACRPAVDARRHRLTLTLPPEGTRVVVDPTRLEQIIVNLLTNAAKYTNEGGEIALSTEQAAAHVTVRVRDTGVGIPAELLPHVFDLFVQGDRSLARSEGGLGIGLTLVRSLVQLHGGTVEAHSAGPGRGSEFVVRLPLADDAGAERCDAAGPEAGRVRPGGRRVLVVEDNRDGAESLAFLLRLQGHQLRTVYDGAEALDAALAFRPQVVLLDIGLPGLSGYEVARKLRELPGFETTVLVAMTGYGRDEDRRQSLDAGFDCHLVKPVDLEELKRLLAAAEVAGP